MSTVKSVAVIGAGPSGAAAAEALRRSNAFDVIKVFERRAEVGGAWYGFSLELKLYSTND
jgi:cation diffusion facilitator CzcD-associated flavoprotein CzcO